MSRRRRAKIRQQKPDSRYGSTKITRFIKYTMWNGNITLAEKIVYTALDSVCGKISQEENLEDISATKIFNQIIENVSPLIEVRSRRVGGATHQVPSEVSPRRREALAMRWLVLYSRKGKGRAMHEKLADEFYKAYNNTGDAVKKKDEVHKMAEANKVFAHFAIRQESSNTAAVA